MGRSNSLATKKPTNKEVIETQKRRIEELEKEVYVYTSKIEHLEECIKDLNGYIEYLELPFYERWFLKVFMGTK